jgi:hypothetical protein
VVDNNLKIMGSIGAFAALVAIVWFFYSAYHSGDDMRCAQENVQRARDGVPRLNCG